MGQESVEGSVMSAASGGIVNHMLKKRAEGNEVDLYERDTIGVNTARDLSRSNTRHILEKWDQERGVAKEKKGCKGWLGRCVKKHHTPRAQEGNPGEKVLLSDKYLIVCWKKRTQARGLAVG